MGIVPPQIAAKKGRRERRPQPAAAGRVAVRRYSGRKEVGTGLLSFCIAEK
jgi:hypothetical protein